MVVGVGVLSFLFTGGRLGYSHQEIKTCFVDAGGLKAGAFVRTLAEIQHDGLLGPPVINSDISRASGADREPRISKEQKKLSPASHDIP